MALGFNAHFTIARSEEEARARLVAVDADPQGVEAMAPKMRHYSIKLEGVPSAGANIVKQAMLSLGGEAAESVGAYAGKADATDMILMGTVAQLETLAEKLIQQPFGLAELGRDLPGLIGSIEQSEFDVPLPKGMLKLGGRPLLMGILNCTPDSFYDGGRYATTEDAIARGRQLIAGGADILDVGGESTRPGSDPVSEGDELGRVIPVIEALAGPAVVISIDTQKPAVAARAVKAGASIINDVSALADPEMARVAARTGAALVLMHMLGTPKTMQQDPHYGDLFGEVIGYLRERMGRAIAAGVKEESILADPGIGFGKTVAHNLELVRDLWRLKSLGRPIVLGHSNKMFIGKVLGADKDGRTEGTAAVAVAGVLAGANIIRVHDVAAMKRFVDMAWAVKLGENWSESD